MEKDSVSIQFVRAAVARLDASERARVLQAAGIPADLLQTEQARVPAASFAALWLAVAQACDDEFFRLDRRRMKVGSFALLAHALVGADDLATALRLMLRAFRAFLDDVHGELRLQDQQAEIVIVNRIADPEARRFADETFLVMVHGLLCWLAGRRVPLQSAQFAYPRPPYAQEYVVMYSQQLAFDRGLETRVCFDARYLSLPVVQHARSLKVFLRTAPQSVFLKYKNEAGWAARVRKRLRGAASDADWPVLEDMARTLNVAPTTLRRRLEAEGASYQSIKDALRRDVAIERLSHTSLSIADIAAEVGFLEPSAFYRAFRKWTGVAPGAYRQQRGNAADGVPGAEPR